MPLNFSEEGVEDAVTALPARPKDGLALVEEEHGVGHIRLSEQTPEICVRIAALSAPAREGGEVNH